MFYFVFAIILLAIGYFYCEYMKIVESVAHIPGPPALPFLGNALMFVSIKSSGLTKLASEITKKYGLFVRILLGPKIMVLLCDPLDVEDFLVNIKSTEKSEEYDYVKPWIGEGLITSSGKKWQSRRKILTPGFHFGILEEFVKVFDQNSKILVDKLKNQNSIDFYPLALLFALDNICGEIRLNQS
jgi:cytochrome P450 family 4